MENTSNKVAIVLVNWNNYEDTFNCLKSLEKQRYKNFTVFLVDNDSQDNSYQLLKDNYSENSFELNITFMKTNENIGFAGGNNVAIKAALEQGFRFFWLLNNDTILDENALWYLFIELKDNKNTGIVGSKIYYFNTNKIWFAGGKVNKFTGHASHIGMKKDDSEEFSRRRTVDYITGCSLFFRKELIKDVGYLQEDYFLYYEETDWNLRVDHKGWNIVYIPESVVYHKVGTKSGGTSNVAPYVSYYDIRNSFIMIKRTQPKLIAFCASCFVFLNAFKKILKVFLFNQDRKTERIWYAFRGIYDSFRVKMGKHPDFNFKNLLDRN